MADSMNVTGSTTGIDISKWKKLTAQEIIKEESKGEEIPAEIVSWAQQMAAFSKIPDDVTYEQVENAQAPTQTEEPGAVKDVDRPEELGEETTQDQNIFMNPTPGFAAETGSRVTEEQNIEEENQQLTLADPTLTTDPEEIRKRKARRGLE